jgi:hypothetical protein
VHLCLSSHPHHLQHTDTLWGFTPLHLAANLGLLPIIEYLLSLRASIYTQDRQGRTAEQVAMQSGHNMIQQRLQEERMHAPAQYIYNWDIQNPDNNGNLSLVYNNSNTNNSNSNQRTTQTNNNNSNSNNSNNHNNNNINNSNDYNPFVNLPLYQFWIGDEMALEANYCTDIEFTHVIYLKAGGPMMTSDNNNNNNNNNSTNSVNSKQSSNSNSTTKSSNSNNSNNSNNNNNMDQYPSHMKWLKKEKHLLFTSYTIPITLEDGDHQDHYEALLTLLPSILTWITSIVTMIQQANEELLFTLQQEYLLQQQEQQSKMTSNSLDNNNNHNHKQKNQLLKSDMKVSFQQMKLLICDETGQSLSPALLAMILLMKFQIRIPDTIACMKLCRPSINIRHKILRGLDQLQQLNDQKVLKRLQAKLRGTLVNSVAF